MSLAKLMSLDDVIMVLLLELPDLVLNLILQSLDVKDVVRFSTLSKRAHDVAHFVVSF